MLGKRGCISADRADHPEGNSGGFKKLQRVKHAERGHSLRGLEEAYYKTEGQLYSGGRCFGSYNKVGSKQVVLTNNVVLEITGSLTLHMVSEVLQRPASGGINLIPN